MNRTSSKLTSIFARLTSPVNASTLGGFRILFGISMLAKTIREYLNNKIQDNYIDLGIHFPYELFPWVKPWAGDGMYYHFGIMGAAALLMALGLFYRLAAVTFFITYTYVFLIDKAYYNNHLYFICLLAFLFCFVNAHRWMSLDALLKRKFTKDPPETTIPYWHVFIMKAQVFIVYFYGGIAKINYDWLRGEPMRHWLIPIAERENTPSIVANFMQSELGVYFFSYGGLIFDLGIGFILLYRKTRLLGFLLVLIFNATNHWMFTIGIFPFLMVAATILFLEVDTPDKLSRKLYSNAKSPKIKTRERTIFQKNMALSFVTVYLAIQVLLPFRHWLYEGYVSWTEEGSLFSWHMKLNSKRQCNFGLMASDPISGEKWPIIHSGHLSYRQFKRMCRQPHMIIQYAHFIKGKLENVGTENPILKAKVQLSLNFRPPQDMIDPDANLAEEEYSTFRHADWILPLKE